MTKAKNPFTYEQAAEYLSYDPDTGIITWRKNRGRIRSGSVAGCLVANEGGKKYIHIMFMGRLQYGHRLGWLLNTGEWPKHEIDHINGNGADNRLINLRQVNRSENQRNKRKHRNNTSGITGVMWRKKEKKWRARITVNGKKKDLGNYFKKSEAVAARRKAEIDNNFHENHGSDRPL